MCIRDSDIIVEVDGMSVPTQDEFVAHVKDVYKRQTRNRVMGVLTKPEYQIVFLDTPGVTTPKNRLGEYMLKIAYDSLNEVEAVLFLTDADVYKRQSVNGALSNCVFSMEGRRWKLPPRSGSVRRRFPALKKARLSTCANMSDLR